MYLCGVVAKTSVYKSIGQKNIEFLGYMTPWCRASCGACNPKTYQLSVGKFIFKVIYELFSHGF